jgi:rhodanese-related sulfurtransferase
MVAEAKTKIAEVTPTEAMGEGDGVVYLDCREANEYNLGHIPGATFIPRGQIEQKVEAIIPREKRVIIYCASGNRSALAADTMQQMGYSDVASMSGGFRGWVDAGGAVE